MGRFGINRDSYGFEIPDIYNNAASGYTFSAEYQTVYDSFIVKPAADIAQQQDIMVRALVAGGVWAVMDIFYVQANNDQANALINWLNPGTFDLTINGVHVFTAYEGFVPNVGAGNTLDTNWNTATDAVNYQRNDACFGFYNRGANIGETRVHMGHGSARIWPRWATNLGYAMVNAGASSNGAVISSQGLFIGHRDDAANQELYRNNVQVTTGAVGSAALLNANFFIYSDAAAGNTPLNPQHSMGFASAALNNAERQALQDAFETYMDYNGKGII